MTILMVKNHLETRRNLTLNNIKNRRDGRGSFREELKVAKVFVLRGGR